MIVPPLQVFWENAFAQNALTLSAIAQSVIERVLNSVPESFLIALFAWMLLRLLPGQSSRTRFAVWFMALLAVASLPWLPQLAGVSLSSGTCASRGATPLLASNGVTRFLARPLSSVAAHAIQLSASWASFFFVAWITAASALSLRLIVGLWRLHQLRQTCKTVDPAALDPSLAALFAELTGSQALSSRPVSLAISDLIRVPAAIGLWKPMIVLPEWALRDLPPSDLGIVIRHEFAHLRHFDDWTNLVQKVVRVLFFFHPAVWWIEKRLSVEREMACDDAVVAQTSNPAGYASCLVSLLEKSLSERGWTMAQAFSHRARETSLRLARILDRNRPVATRISKPALALVAAFALFCVVILPETPQLVSFEQRSQAANTSYSASISRPTMPTTIATTMASTTITSKKIADTTIAPPAIRANYPVSPAHAVPAVASLKSELKQISPPARQASAQTASRSAVVIAQRTATPAQPNSAPPTSAQSAALESATSAPERNAFLAVLSEAMLDEHDFLAAKNGSPAPSLRSAVLVIHTTEFVESDSASPARAPATVWRIQVWRVTFVEPTWQRKAANPAAHST